MSHSLSEATADLLTTLLELQHPSVAQLLVLRNLRGRQFLLAASERAAGGADAHEAPATPAAGAGEAG
eukprot:CAMPEP_0196793848 /NCGR_PEP_ID=MMETSP1104-20130614/33587_1 /TAXON_ID=33652 /ORGANISM="Cafeteria sp., Strain Caron Lab Isolate" /LENGTH=67 /DNA_ID=CAMNT_0042164221 /DNA_START=72 /DNA_END=271 /DNA_ORIENTATION=-